ncbi:MAG: hypothetical protein GY856_45330 [bacterium]|nr:hypothetical protein [bacterium]
MFVTVVLMVAGIGLPVPGGEPADTPSWCKTLGYGPNEIHRVRTGKFGYAYVRVLVNGREVELPFDTGNMTGLGVSPEIAERSRLEEAGETTHYHASGQVAGSYKVFKVREFVAFGRTWNDQLADEEWRPGLDGLLGPRYVNGGRFTLDAERGILAVSSSPFPDEAPGTRIPMVRSPAPDLEELILIPGSVNGVEVLVELDTGKSRCVVDPELAKSLHLPEARNGYRFDEIRLGPFTFSVPSAKESNLRGISEGLSRPVLVGVGIDLLSQLLFSVDYSQRIVILQSP